MYYGTRQLEVPISFFSMFVLRAVISMLSRQRDTSRFKCFSCNSTLHHVSLLCNGWLKKNLYHKIGRCYCYATQGALALESIA